MLPTNPFGATKVTGDSNKCLSGLTRTQGSKDEGEKGHIHNS
jgi:hypothetical protein